MGTSLTSPSNGDTFHPGRNQGITALRGNIGNNRMENPMIEHESKEQNPMSIFSGLGLGSLAGTRLMLLLAPQSGTKIRAKIQKEHLPAGVESVNAVVQDSLD